MHEMHAIPQIPFPNLRFRDLQKFSSVQQHTSEILSRRPLSSAAPSIVAATSASPRTLAALPQPGEPCALYTELVVREDLLQLFGFPTLAEKEWHRLLTSVQGVGPRSALA